MGFLNGKKLLITGVLSNRSIAYGIARACHQQGAELAFSYVGDRFKDRITEFAAEFGSKLIFDCDVDGFGDWDEHRILQAVSNLTTNAVKHGTPGTPVHVRVTGDADQVAVEVRNQGSIPRELLPHIFDPFRSGHHHGSRGEGLGLGLFIVKAIAGAHGGGVEVDAREGDTSFRLVLPRRPKAENAARA